MNHSKITGRFFEITSEIILLKEILINVFLKKYLHNFFMTHKNQLFEITKYKR